MVQNQFHHLLVILIDTWSMILRWDSVLAIMHKHAQSTGLGKGLACLSQYRAPVSCTIISHPGVALEASTQL